MPLSNNPSDYKKKNDDIIRSNEYATTGDAYFYSLCRPVTEKKKRKCLRCRKIFKSEGFHHRACGNCKKTIAKQCPR